jgi:hypothetical protein
MSRKRRLTAAHLQTLIRQRERQLELWHLWRIGGDRRMGIVTNYVRHVEDLKTRLTRSEACACA